ncbi:biotin--protein ligase isoform X2 [Odontomachus brunneus]|uniref:biotin--protein ligase isoform X2 n=1 Tax=Odontomachus brunneus TaxID=486640 RepID=UPI0013F1F6B7|nr:biotin--protein ligase isoform X2 [Odontomachus brunneus]
MFLTIFYMIATFMKARATSLLKKYFNTIFEGENESSILLYSKLPKYISSITEDVPKEGMQNISNDNILTPLKYKKYFTKAPKFEKLLFQEGDIKLYSVCPQLEDYGLIMAWTANPDSIDFILKTDIDHITNFMIAIVGEQYYMNNRVSFTCIQSVAVSGKPCTYDIEDLNSSSTANAISTTQIDLDTYVEKLIALSTAAEEADRKQKSQKIVGYSVHPQNQETDAKISSPNIPVEPVQKSIHFNDIENGTETLQTSHLRSFTDIKKHDLESTVTPVNISTTSKEACTASNVTKKSGDSAIFQSYDAVKKKDNILLSTNKEIKDTHQSKSTIETRNIKTPFTLKKDEKCGGMLKPPNVVIYADSPDAINNVKTVLEKALDTDRYIIYALSRETACSNVWVDQVALVVICGNVDSEIKTQLVEYVIHGGKLLALCSDMLHTLLPSFKTAEVRESELVHFSYGKWKRVRMMHHIFCYHASPVRARFSQDQEDIRTPGLNTPSSTSVKDKKGNLYSFNVKVLGTEETWHNPSILLATLASSGGKVVFSQIHLEVDPTQYEYEEDKFKALKENNVARLEIISDLLSTHLEMETKNHVAETAAIYTPAYFLGRYEEKIEVLKKLKSKMQPYDLLKMSQLSIQFCSKFNELQRIAPSASCLPILIHGCPDNFSTTKYFEMLDTKKLGRLVIYADVLTSSMHVTDCTLLEHGLAVIPRQQTKGLGRGRNMWLSPIGCAMFTLQMHFELNSVIGSRISILQHYIAVAIVHAVRSKSGYEDINIRLKWPNDIYIGNSTKIGGLLVKTKIDDRNCICDIGSGINLFNSKPTLCINTAIEDYNQKYGTNLQMFSYEEFIAQVFNCIEYLIDRIIHQEDIKFFYELYYKYWLHENSNVTVVKRNGESENVVIKGIDDFGYLLVEDGKGNKFSLHPDGNTFDLLKGLIIPK